VTSFRLSRELFERLPRHPDWKYEYINGQAMLSPRPRALRLRRPTGQPVTQVRPGIEIRALDAGADGAAVAALLTEVWSREDPYRSYDDQGKTLRGEIERGLSTARFGAVAMDQGAQRAAALVHGEHEQPTLTWLTVGFEARERGLATALLAWICVMLNERGVRELASGASAANLASLRWHLSRGFALAADPIREAQRSVVSSQRSRPGAG
jgi:hypothetical protein